MRDGALHAVDLPSFVHSVDREPSGVVFSPLLRSRIARDRNAASQHLYHYPLENGPPESTISRRLVRFFPVIVCYVALPLRWT